eukprot:9492317-Pyramimonas_sp.AAC.1
MSADNPYYGDNAEEHCQKAQAEIGAFAASLARSDSGWVSGSSITELARDKLNPEYEKVDMSCFDNASTFSALKALITALPGPAPPSGQIREGLRAADAMVGFKLSGGARMSSSWTAEEAQKIHMLWSFLWSCFSRSPDRSKSVPVQRLKFILHSGGVVPARRTSSQSSLHDTLC